MWTPLQALFFGLFSALSLPLGALIGIVLNPVSERVTACFMAFGSGAVISAYATQLYGKALMLLEEAKDPMCGAVSDPEAQFWNVLVEITTGVIGASIYYFLNKWLQRMTGSISHSTDNSNNGPEFSEVRDMEHGRSGGLDRSELFQTSGPRPQEQSATTTMAVPLARAQTGPVEGDAPPAHWKSAQPAAHARTWAPTAVDMTAPLVHSLEPRPSLAHQKSRLPSLSHKSAAGAAEPRLSGVALSMWLGVALDGIPEALMMGFMTNDGSLSWAFLVALFIANFPEAFAAASLLRDQGVKPFKIMMMWVSVFVMIGVIAFIGCWAVPDDVPEGSTIEKVRTSTTAALQGLAGGMMLAMMSTAMLPEAFHGAGDLAGCIFVLGFVLSVLLEALGIKYGEPQESGSF